MKRLVWEFRAWLYDTLTRWALAVAPDGYGPPPSTLETLLKQGQDKLRNPDGR